jgi:anthranilate synthase component 2
VPSSVPDCLEVLADVDGEIMAIKHKDYDVIGVQFHPESINTPEGMKLIKNFIDGRF